MLRGDPDVTDARLQGVLEACNHDWPADTSDTVLWHAVVNTTSVVIELFIQLGGNIALRGYNPHLRDGMWLLQAIDLALHDDNQRRRLVPFLEFLFRHLGATQAIHARNDRSKRTALHMAAIADLHNTETPVAEALTRLLLWNGATLFAEDVNGLTPFALWYAQTTVRDRNAPLGHLLLRGGVVRPPGGGFTQ
jgi:hypothetical protein